METELHSILEGVGPKDLQDPGFPVLIREQALPEAYYEILAENFPALEAVVDGDSLLNNARYRLEAQRCLDDEALPEIWRRFLAYHTSAVFFDDIRRVFGPALTRTHPDLAHNFGKPLDEFTVGLRRPGKDRDPHNHEYDLVLDAQFGWNSPVSERSAARGPHLDSPRKLFTALLYFRDPEDQSTGGAFELLRPNRPGYPRPKPSRIDAETVSSITSIPYAANTMVMFVNSPNAIHRVTPRSVTPSSRRFVAIMGECYGGKAPDFFIAPETRTPYWWRQALRTWHRYL